MATLTFSTIIHATPEKVWEKLWEDKNYRQWTAVFSPGSHAKSDWEEGSRIEFRGEKEGGMYAVIEQKVPNESMVFKHLGEIKDGKDVATDWGEAYESYQLIKTDNDTLLNVTLTMDVPPEIADYFKETFPKALEILKGMAEEG
ncbi:MAG: hypothetical protein JWQ27_2212 [Ferruginibacter sp.]|nr:hypothetical protein [Ferruginibacter sp.]